MRTPNGLGVLSYAGCNALLLDPAFRPGIFEMMRRAGPDGTRCRRSAHPARLRRRRPPRPPARRHALVHSTTDRDAPRTDRRSWSATCSTRWATPASCEFMADVATRIPPTIFCWMVGCDVERGPGARALVGDRAAGVLRRPGGDGRRSRGAPLPAALRRRAARGEATRTGRRHHDRARRRHRGRRADALRRAVAAHGAAERVGRQHHALDGPHAVAPLRTPRSVGARRG